LLFLGEDEMWTGMWHVGACGQAPHRHVLAHGLLLDLRCALRFHRCVCLDIHFEVVRPENIMYNFHF
jgi:hypothetical protein